MNEKEEFILLLRNLDVINNIKINDKIIINDNIISIDKYSIFRPITRRCSKQNREQIHLYLIKMIEDLIRHLEYFVEYKSLKNQKDKKIPKITTIDKYFEIQYKYLNLKNIVDILIETYKSDKEYCRKLFLLKERINRTDPNYYTYYLLQEKLSLSVIGENQKFKYSNSF